MYITIQNGRKLEKRNIRENTDRVKIYAFIE